MKYVERETANLVSLISILIDNIMLEERQTVPVMRNSALGTSVQNRIKSHFNQKHFCTMPSKLKHKLI